jgi:hypothetical protein
MTHLTKRKKRLLTNRWDSILLNGNNGRIFCLPEVHDGLARSVLLRLPDILLERYLEVIVMLIHDDPIPHVVKHKEAAYHWQARSIGF